MFCGLILAVFIAMLGWFLHKRFKFLAVLNQLLNIAKNNLIGMAQAIGL